MGNSERMLEIGPADTQNKGKGWGGGGEEEKKQLTQNKMGAVKIVRE